MTPTTPDADLLCDRCGYDLRGHRQEEACPECGLPVGESRRLAAVPRRPAWRASDPRWRRRILAGVWVLVLLPLVDVLQATGWAAAIPVPVVFDFRGTVRTLDDTFVCNGWVYPPLAFCIGVVLLFSRQRGRRPNRLAWTRRWGVLCTYATFVLAAAPMLFISALVLIGIGSLFLSMPSMDQPGLTPWFVGVGSAYLRYGPQPHAAAAGVVQAAFSSVAVLLACVPLYDALRSSGPERAAALLVAPLALFSLAELARVARSCIGIPGGPASDVSPYGVYFCPAMLVGGAGPSLGTLAGPGPPLAAVVVEFAKWATVLTIAVWLSIARVLRGTGLPRHPGGEPPPVVISGGTG